MASPVFFRGDRTDRRLSDLLDAMQAQIDIVMLTAPHDVFADGRFEMYYRLAGVDHPAAVEHVLNWLDSHDRGWREYLSVGLPHDQGWT